MNTPDQPRPRPRLSPTGEYLDPATGAPYTSGTGSGSQQWSHNGGASGASPQQPSYNYVQQPMMQSSGIASKKVAAGVCGILIGGLGIHKFILGYTNAGLIMLLVSILTCGIGWIPMTIIGLVEGIMYLTKSDADFEAQYGNNQRPWF